jgi:uncharacterized protein (DUF1778 family)
MTGTHRNRKSRAVEVRFTEEQKETIGRAAALLDLPLSDFIAASAIHAAETVLTDRRKMKLTPQDSLLFAKAILNPHVPNDALREVFVQHDLRVLPGSDKGSE